MTTPSRSIAIIGAGLAGTGAALALARAGFRVDLYSDRTRDSLLNNVPATGTAILFGASRTADARIIDDPYAGIPAAHFAASAAGLANPDNPTGVDSFPASYSYEAQSVDPRLRADDRLDAFLDLADPDKDKDTHQDATDSAFHVGTVTPTDLDRIAASHDLTLLATGKGGLADAFATDHDRTPYTGPQRRVLTVTATGLPSDHVFTGRTGGEQSDRLTDATGRPVNNALLSLHEEGEVFVGPYLHKDGLESWVILAWARPGTATEQAFAEATDAESALRILQDLHRRVLPDVADDLDLLRPVDADPHSWLKGAVTARVRRPVGYTAGGHLVAALGDTAIAVDPIAGQGAQLGDWQVAALVDGLVAAETADQAWDADLLTDLFEAHWTDHGAAGVAVTSLFLGDPLYAEVAGAFFSNAATDPAYATALFSLFSEPAPALTLRTAEDVAALAASFRNRTTERTTEQTTDRTTDRTTDKVTA
ncbi:FAD-dependent oxidoreductase [uncultured Corynebacterium sp.]|uniref:FAD-dependent oxidoreductase n=1 Tax=uncultured Corynebacterium sp. TaxID=159447 RepID=UPI0025F38A71|nr:styrene monooxygenase/indole monooxygenase family protein [uncultured Corynebacterium sp.]